MPLHISVSPDKLVRRRRLFKSRFLIACRADEKFYEAQTQRGCLMKWITYERSKTNPIVCRWLVTRIIDKGPEFVVVRVPRMLATAAETGAGIVGILYCGGLIRRFPPALSQPLPRQLPRRLLRYRRYMLARRGFATSQ
jgi:hypothetical protein